MLIPAITVGLSLAYSESSTKIYQGTVSLLLTPQLSTTLLQANNSNYPTATVDVPTDTEIIESQAVSRLVSRTIPNPPQVAVAEAGTTNVVLVSAKSPDPKVAAEAANAFAKAYISLQESEAVDTLTSASQIVQSHINSVQGAINSLNAQINDSADSASDSGLTTELQSLEAERTTLQGELSNYQFAASVGTGGGQVLTPATVSTRPVSPKTVEFATLALILGLLIGFVLSLLLEFLDDDIRTKTDLEGVGHGLPVLGLLPEIVDWRDSHANYLVSRSTPKSAPAEAYRSLRTSIQFLGLDQSLRTLQFTSPNASEGKTTTLANLAVVMSHAGARVIVVCCDLRRPRVHEFFGVSNFIGFTSVLLGEATLEQALQSVPGMENIRVLASGQIPPNPSELLSSSRTSDILAALSKQADIVLIDSPPVLPVTDAVVLAGRVDGVVVVTASRVSNKSQLVRSLELLERVEAPIAGLILNRAAESDTYSYYHYSYGTVGSGGKSSPEAVPDLLSQATPR
jgi:capsular exopolysaccharide synthesis family protein